jgi:serine protease AprX
VQGSLKSSASESGAVPQAALAGISFTRQTRDVDIVLHPDVGTPSAELTKKIAEAAHVDGDLLTFSGGKVRLTLEERYLDNIAAIDEVRYIREYHPAKLRNNRARVILGADVTIGDVAYKGDGEVVAVADTGFDNGQRQGAHPAFGNRVRSLYAWGRPNRKDDPSGHGTHVSGSVLGDGNSAGMGGQIEAPASRAGLVVQSLLDARGGLGGIPDDLEKLFIQPYQNDSARVHTNSWGSSPPPGTPQLSYDEQSTAIDKFVRDHPDMVICFAAGNDGVDRDANGLVDRALIGSQAAAKNCITVGATEGNRPEIQVPEQDYHVPPRFPPDPRIPFTWGGYWPGDYPTAPIFADHMANDPDGLAAFSSRGPTKEGRFKPDVVAPGTSILSTRSRRAQDPGHWGISRDANWMFDSGTSMATPLVAGCCAVLRETLVKKGHQPSAALIKALLINGAVDVVGQFHPTEAGPSPNNNSGFGRVNLHASIIIPGTDPMAGCGDSTTPLDTDDEFTVDVQIPGAGDDELGVQPGDESSRAAAELRPGPSTLKVTLVYTDKEGTRLHNDLNLIVVAPDGKSERHGNMGTRTFPADADRPFDRLNNVEQVVWTGIAPGIAVIKIKAFRVATMEPQSFAYAWRLI